MKNNDATELAYKNGYEAGVDDLLCALCDFAVDCTEYQCLSIGEIKEIAKELIGGAE